MTYEKYKKNMKILWKNWMTKFSPFPKRSLKTHVKDEPGRINQHLQISDSNYETGIYLGIDITTIDFLYPNYFTKF